MVEVSAAKRNITPPFPVYMRGYAMRTGKSIGVLDELYCRTLVLRIDGEIFIFCSKGKYHYRNHSYTLWP